MTSIHPITASDRPVFPCWLWRASTYPHWQFFECYIPWAILPEYSHYCIEQNPASPTAPTESPSGLPAGAAIATADCLTTDAATKGNQVVAAPSGRSEEEIAAPRVRLNQGLHTLAIWCQNRAMGDHDIDTTLTMLTRKADELRAAVKATALREAKQPQVAPMVVNGVVNQTLREKLGKLVREVWIDWAREQPNPKSSWLVEWDGLNEPDKEVDRRIGQRLYFRGIREAQIFSPANEPDAPEPQVASAEYITNNAGHAVDKFNAQVASAGGETPRTWTEAQAIMAAYQVGDATESDMMQHFTKLERELAATVAKLSEAEEAIETLQQNVFSRGKEITRLKEMHATQQDSAMRWRRELKESQRTARENNERLAAARKECELVTVELAGLVRTNETLCAERDTLATRVKELDDTRERAIHQLNGYDAQLAAAQQTIAGYRDYVEYLKQADKMTAGYLYAHNWHYPTDFIARGDKLRAALAASEPKEGA